MVYNFKKKISAIFNFTNGILDGDVICYDPSTQCIDVHETYKNGKKIKEKRYYQSIYIGRRNIQKKSKYYKFFPGDCYDSKYPKYYPIPPELEPFIDSYYLIHEYFNKDLYNKHHNLEEEKEINPWTK